MGYQYDTLIYNVRIASMQDNKLPYGELPPHAIAIKDGKIAALLPCDDSLDNVFEQAKSVIDATTLIPQNEGSTPKHPWLLPGFIDCHTHLVYGGNRAEEFEMRLQGASYVDIAQRGGGIKGTVEKTRRSDENTLLHTAIKRAKRLCEEGVTTIEVKSGYGLDLDTEVRMLRVAKSLEQHLPVSIKTTYLGAHALPNEFADDSEGYFDFICNKALPHIASQNLADAVDVFCETIGFSTSQTDKE